MKKVIFGVICIILFINRSIAQGEIGDKKTFSIKEESIAFILKTNGYGGNLMYGKRIDGTRRRIFNVDFEYTKDPKEIKTHNPYYDNNNRFVFGKLNDFYNLRTGIGLQKELFSKFDKGGVSIKYFYSGGLSLGLLKPIYYDIIDSTRIIYDKQYIYTNPKKFSNSIHTSSDIYGRTSFFKKGMNEIEPIPGIFIKAGISVEYSKNEKSIHAIEAGFMTDFFYKNIVIMDNQKNNQIFISLFIGMRFGKVYFKKEI